MIWNYRVVREGSNYTVKEVFYEEALDDSSVEEFSNESVLGYSDIQEIGFDSDNLKLEGEYVEDKESVRSIVKLLYMMIDDVRGSKVIDSDDINFTESMQ